MMNQAIMAGLLSNTRARRLLTRLAVRAAPLALLLSLPFTTAAAEPPAASINNGVVRAKLYLPDVDNGYYARSGGSTAGPSQRRCARRLTSR